MKYLRLIVMAGLIGLMLPFGAFAQKGGKENRPPKEDQKIKERDKGEKPPPSNSNRRGRP